MLRHQRFFSGPWAFPHGLSCSAQYIGLIYRAVAPLNFFMPSFANPIQVSVETVGFRNSFRAESFTRAQWRSRSGVTPSKARAPSNTTEHSHAAWVRGPIIGILPSCHSLSKKVTVF